MSAGRPARRAAALVVAWLAGCASVPPPVEPGPVTPAPAPPATPAPSAPPPDLAAFEMQQRQAAEAAARQGRWTDAQWAWDVVIALQPKDADAAARRAQAAAAGQAAAAERLQRARQAQQRGDLDAAARAYLDVLALAPEQAEAAEALRAIERERVRRSPSRPFARAPAAKPPPASVETDARGVADSELEHASMLATQGEIDAAIALLQPTQEGRRKDPAAAALLGDLYWRQAERLLPTDRAGAIAALERCLRVQPRHAQARARLRELRGAPAP